MFQNISKSVPEYWDSSQKCSGSSRTLLKVIRNTFEILLNIKIWFDFRKHSSVFGNIKTVFRSVRETLRCFQKCSTNFSLFQNFQICFGNILKNALEKFQDCSETFWVVLAACRDCSIFQNILKHLVCIQTFQSVLEYFKISFENISKIIFGIFQECSRNIKMFLNSVLELLVYPENFQIYVGNIRKCSGKVSRLFQKICIKTVPKHFNNVLKH